MKQPQVTKDLDDYQAITVPIKDTSRLLREPTSWDFHYILLNYVYVIELKSFVNIDKPQLIIHKDYFDETFETLKMPRGVTPSSYVRDLNNETRKVYSMQMNCTTSKRIYTSDDQIKYLNIYKPAPILYMEKGTYQKPKRLLNHLDYILNRDPLAVDHVLKWITHLVFKPEIRMAHGLMISGDPRTGKSFFANLIELLIGTENFLKIDPDNLTGKFKDAILGKRVLIVEELKNRTDRNLYIN